jgi:enoyl-CoA hydratase
MRPAATCYARPVKLDLNCLTVSVDAGVANLRMNRPKRANALSREVWSELREAAHALDADPSVRVVVLGGEGAHFCAGIDVGMLDEFLAQRGGEHAGGDGAACDGRASERMRRIILDLQDVLTSFERCRTPVLAEVQGFCIGAGLDLAVACDLRYASADAQFVLKEVDMGLAADVGVLQRLPRIVGEGVAREMAYTCRAVSGREAADLRLVNRCFDNPKELSEGVREIARELAAKSPLAMRRTKHAITYARDHTVADGLEQIATWNGGMLLSADLDEALAAYREKRPGSYQD